MYTSYQQEKRNLFSRKKTAAVLSDDADITEVLNKLRSELEFVHNNLDNVTDQALIDSYIYEIKALHMKYDYYLNLCKKKSGEQSFVS